MMEYWNLGGRGSGWGGGEWWNTGILGEGKRGKRARCRDAAADPSFHHSIPNARAVNFGCRLILCDNVGRDPVAVLADDRSHDRTGKIFDLPSPATCQT